jgi:hypothetical protein
LCAADFYFPKHPNCNTTMEEKMKSTKVTLPELGLIAGTRGILGAGLGLLVGDRLSESQRKAVGWALFLVGAISTVPLAFEVFGRRRWRSGDGATRRESPDHHRSSRHPNGRSRKPGGMAM